MSRTRRPSPQTVSLLDALAAEPTSWRYGYDLCRELDLKAGTVYPILVRLAERGHVETQWEQDPPAGRPPRHLYRLSAQGRELAAELARAATARSRHPRGAVAARVPGVVTG